MPLVSIMIQILWLEDENGHGLESQYFPDNKFTIDWAFMNWAELLCP